MKKVYLLLVGILLFAGGVGVGVLLERRGVFGARSPGGVPPEQPDDTAALIVGKWQEEDGSNVTEYKADGRFTSPEITTVNGKVTDTKVTEGTYRIVGPRQVEMTFRFESLAKKPEFTSRLAIKEITADRLVTVDGSGVTRTAKRVRE